MHSFFHFMAVSVAIACLYLKTFPILTICTNGMVSQICDMDFSYHYFYDGTIENCHYWPKHHYHKSKKTFWLLFESFQILSFQLPPRRRPPGCHASSRVPGDLTVTTNPVLAVTCTPPAPTTS